MRKRLSQAQRLNAMMDAYRLQVCELLGWEETDYQHYLFETGMRYIECYTDYDKDVIDILKSDRRYWAWWRLHWHKRDTFFLNLYHDWHISGAHIDKWDTKAMCKDRSGRQYLYATLHSATDLAKGENADAQVLEVSYIMELMPQFGIVNKIY